MRNYGKKRSFWNLLHSWPVLALLFILVLFFAWGVIGLVRKMAVTRENRQIAAEKVERLRTEKAKLSGDIDTLNTESGVEKSIREKFGLAKEGEGLIIVVDDKNAPVEKEAEDEGFFSFLKFWLWFK